MKSILLMLAFCATTVFSAHLMTASEDVLDRFKNDIVESILNIEGQKHGTHFQLAKINSVNYVAKSTEIEVKFVLNRSDYSLLPDLSCTALVKENGQGAFPKALVLVSNTCVNLPKANIA